MKLRNLLFGTMIALAFTACSSDNDPIIEPTPDPVAEGTTLSLRLNPMTKAETGDAIENLYAVIAKADGTIEKIQAATDTELLTQEVKEITLSAGTKTVVMLANVSEGILDYEGDDLTDLLAVAAELSIATDESMATGEELFTMNSKAHESIIIYEGQKHFLGYVRSTTDGNVYYDAEVADKPVRMYRNVAMVNVKEINMGTTVYMDRAKTKPLHNAEFTIDEIAVVQSMAKSKLAGANFGEWASTFVGGSYVSGYTAGEYGDFDKGTNFDNLDPYAGTQVPLYHRDMDGIDVKDYTAIDPFYVYENTNTTGILTLVTIKGTISGDSKWIDANENEEVDEGETSEPVSMSDRYYTVAVGISGYPDGYQISGTEYQTLGRQVNGSTTPALFKGVLRNLQYDIYATLNGTGSPSPFGPPPGGETGDLDVMVKVVNWGVVTQNVGID